MIATKKKDIEKLEKFLYGETGVRSERDVEGLAKYLCEEIANEIAEKELGVKVCSWKATKKCDKRCNVQRDIFRAIARWHLQQKGYKIK